MISRACGNPAAAMTDCTMYLAAHAAYIPLLCCNHTHTGQCKRTSGCYNELVVAFYSTGGGLKGKKIYTC